MGIYHTSVLLHETIDLLHIQKGKQYIDGTLGGGGHTTVILEKGGKVLGLDVDEEALEYAEQQLTVKSEKLQVKPEDFRFVKGNFRDIDSIVRENGIRDVAGILFDLGVSSHQFDVAERGFSFQHQGPLDMRMDRDLKVKAVDLIHILTKGELYELFSKLGEEPFARSISEGIVRARRISPITTTTQLQEIIRKAVPVKKEGVNPATRVFQALRIAVNDELYSLKEVLPKAYNLLEERGRLAVISFHSLEDRIVKNQFKDWSREGKGTIITDKPVVPSDAEKAENKRSRSAKLRVFAKGTT